MSSHRNPFQLTPTEAKVIELMRKGNNTTRIIQILGVRVSSLRSALEKQHLAAVDHTPKSHAPDSPRKAHGRKLDPFIK